MRFLLVLFVAFSLAALPLHAADPATPVAPARPDGQINAVTALKADLAPGPFHFVILADRTGGERPGVFAAAIDKTALMQPDFVMTVGDIVEGNTPDEAVLNKQWDELNGFAAKLKVPMFYVIGNHDCTSPLQAKLLEQRYGKPYYSFVYRQVLFLVLDTQDPSEHIGDTQLAFAAKVLADNRDVRWTFVFLHHPLWLFPVEMGKSWAKLQELLKGRSATLFAGHLHQYLRMEQDGQKRFVLATTGGKSGPGGRPAGQFDHLVWVSMTDTGPVIANLMLDGICGEDVNAK